MRTCVSFRSATLRAVALCGATLLVACSGRHRAPTTAASQAAAGPPAAPEGTPIAAPLEGPCGSLTELSFDEVRPMLADRLRIGLPAEATPSPLPHDLMAAPPSIARSETRWLVRGHARMAIVVRDPYRSASGTLRERARSQATGGFEVRDLTTSSGLGGVTLRRRVLREVDGHVTVLEALVVLPDDAVIDVEISTSQDVAATGGCVALADRIVKTIAAGTRALTDDGGTRALTPALLMDVPRGWRVVVDEGPDFSVTHVEERVPFGDEGAGIGVYIGSFPRRFAPPNALLHHAPVLGRDAEWAEWQTDGRWNGEVLAASDQGVAHVFYAARDRTKLGHVAGIASTLRVVDTPPRSTFVCGDTDARQRAALAGAETLADDDVRLLRRARRFVTTSASVGEPDLPEFAALRRLVSSPDATRAFLDLAAHGTTAGRLYGLLGLRWVDPARFDAVACEVAAALEPEVAVRDVCGERTESTAALVHRDDAPRGEAFWTASEWNWALSRNPPDLVGGGLGFVVIDGARRDADVIDLARALGSAGVEELAPKSLAPGHGVTPTREAWPRVFSDWSGLFFERTDGSLSRLSALPDEAPTPLPDLVRHPLDYRRGEVTCALDRDGRRRCALVPDLERHVLEGRCGGPNLGDGPVMRRFDDGPWRKLVRVGNHTCGLHEDGSLQCFDGLRVRRPTGAPPSAHAWGDAYRVPIAQRVIDVFDVDYDGVAYTEDGRLWLLERPLIPVELMQIEHVRHVAGRVRDVLFLELEDGRVILAGPFDWDRAQQTNAEAPPRLVMATPPREIPELRGAHVEIANLVGCALHPNDGRVECWGANHAGLDPWASYSADVPPHDIPALHGAHDVYVTVDFGVCARMDAVTIRCLRASRIASDGTPTPATPLDHRLAAEPPRAPAAR